MVKLRWIAYRCFFVGILSVTLIQCSHRISQSVAGNSKVIRVFVIGATDPYHGQMVTRARTMFEAMAAREQFEIYFTTDTSEVTPDNLSHYQVLVQLHKAPFDLSGPQQQAIQQFVSAGHGWIGIHAAGLIGPEFEKEGRPGWPWFDHLMGDADYRPHPPLQKGRVKIEDTAHPITRHLPKEFSLTDEWYEFETLPGPGMKFLAVADENSYTPRKPMGYHPVIWTNPAFHRAVYISVGHDPGSCDDQNFQMLIGNAIQWAAH